MSDIAVVGPPLAGKTTLLNIVRDAFAAPARRSVVHVPSGPMKGLGMTLYEVTVGSEHTCTLRCLPGGVPIECNDLILDAAAGIFIFDPHPERRDRQRELWDVAATRIKQWIALVNKRDLGIVGDAEAFLDSYGASRFEWRSVSLRKDPKEVVPFVNRYIAQVSRSGGRA